MSGLCFRRTHLHLFAVILLLALPWWCPRSLFYLVAVSLVFAVAVLGQNVLVGVGGIASFAGAGFLALGAYSFGHIRLAGGGFALGLVVSALVSVMAGALLGSALARASLVTCAVSTVAFTLAIQQTIAGLPGVSGGALGVAVPPLPVLPGVRDGTSGILAAAVTFCVAGVLTRRVLSTRPGWALQASRDDLRLAASIGVDVPASRVWAFAWSSGLTGLAGGLLAPVAGRLDPGGFSLAESLALFTAVIVGGRGSVLGSLLGAVFVIATPVLVARAGALVPVAFGLSIGLALWLAPDGIGGILRDAVRRVREGTS